MSNKGTFGWKGTGSRALEFPAGFGVDVAPGGRARFRYNNVSGQMEVSFSGAPYVPFAGGAGGGLGAVANIAALAALDDTSLPDGSVVAMASLLDSWLLDKNDTTTTVDGITVIASSAGARWLRMQIPSQEWALRDTWHINEITGDDENDGYTALTAIKTHNELRRRLGKLRLGESSGGGFFVVTIYLDSNITEEIVCDFEFAGDFNGGTPAGFMVYQGARTIVGSGTITNVTNWNNTAGVRAFGSIEAAGLADTWSNLGYVDKMIVSTSGANVGATAWVARDLGGANKEARLSTWWDDGLFSEVNIANGTTFDIVSQTTISNRVIVTGSQSRAVFYDVNVVRTGPFEAALETSNAGGLFTMKWCKISGYVWIENSPYAEFISCAIVQAQATDVVNFIAGCAPIFSACLIKEKVTVKDAYFFIIGGLTNLFQNPGAAGAGGVNITTAPLELDAAAQGRINGNVAFADFALAAAQGAVLLDNASYLRISGTLWGRNITGANYAIVVQASNIIAYDSGGQALPDITAGVVNDTLIGGAATAYGALPAATAATLAGIVQH